MASLRCHGDSDCNKIQIIRNFHLYINWGGITRKKFTQSTHVRACLYESGAPHIGVVPCLGGVLPTIMGMTAL